MLRRTPLPCLILLLLSGQFLQAERHNAEKPLDIGTRLELFVDDYLIDSMTGEVDLKLHTPSSAGQVLDFYKPWEGTTCFYVSVVHGEGLYRMYYRGHSLPSAIAPSLVTPGETVVPEHEEVTCYAESRDGRIWTKPSLGIVEFQGSKDNNIIWDGFGTLNFMVFRDTNPATPAEQRYKALATGKPNRPQKRVVGMVSADGIHWKPIREKALLTQRPTDNGGDGFLWDRVRGEYVALGYPFNRTHCKLRRRGLEKFGYVHDRHSQRAARARGEDPAELLPAVHQVVSLAKRWLLGTHQGSVDEAHLASYLNEFVFRFNRRRSRSRGMVFYRVLELAVAHDPVRYQDLIATKRPRAVPSTPPQGRGHPPSLERPPAKRPSRTAGLDGSG